MKYQFGAAVTALAFALIPGTLSAEPASSTILATSYAMTTKTLSGLAPNFASQKLRHTAATTHQFAIVNKVPPDPCLQGCAVDADVPPDPCRALAAVWNVAVYQNRQQAVFDAIIKAAAVTHCTLEVTRTVTTNADGSSDLVSVTFAPQ